MVNIQHSDLFVDIQIALQQICLCHHSEPPTN